MNSLTNKVGSLCSYGGGNSGSDEEDGGAKRALPPQQPAGPNGGRDVFLEEEPIVFEVNGESVTVDTSWATAQTSLARYLRTHLNLTGTKVHCAQAGCGSCVVTATRTDPGTGQEVTHSVNSCITPVFKCDGWRITTVEGLGNTRDGLGEIQQRVHDNYGSQCGFCTPGMIMAMNSLLQNEAVPEKETIKEVLDGNICRCTGYRPLWDAFLSFNDDPIGEIEDLAAAGKGSKTCPRTSGPCAGACATKNNKKKAKVKRGMGSSGSGRGDDGSARMQYVNTVDGEWMKPETLNDLMALLDGIEDGVRYQLVAGNTGKGVFPNDGPYDQYIDVTGITELHSVVMDGTNLLIGGNVTLTQVMATMESAAASDASAYGYCARFAEHFKKVANTNVRNVATMAGNLMMKIDHAGFASDVFNLLEAVGATINVLSTTGEQTLLTPLDFLDEDMDKKVVLFVSFPKLDSTYRFWTYKVTPRNQNAKAYVNGAMLAPVEVVDSDGSVNVTDKPNVVLGGISGNFHHAETLEAWLIGKNLNDQSTLSDAMGYLETDISNALNGEEPDDYNSHLAKALLYKFFIFAVGDKLNYPELSSSTTQLSWERGVPEGEQELTSGDPSEAPLYAEVKKVEGKAQVTGEAEYTDDIEPGKSELFAAFVISTLASCEFDPDEINVDAAMAMPGVVAYYGASDIPGVNSVTGQIETGPGVINEEIFSSGAIYYCGQPIGMIVADTYEHAIDAAKAVEITYFNEQPPVLSIQQAIEVQRRTGKKLIRKRYSNKFGQRKMTDGRAVVTVEGEFGTGAQYHFHMETQSCIVRPKENRQFEVHSATQWMDGVHNVVANTLAIDTNKLDVMTRRLGGGYGGKIFKGRGVAAAAAVAASALNRPVRMVLDIETNMEAMGKRSPYYFEYSATVDDQTMEIDVINVEVFCDDGFSRIPYETEGPFVPLFIQNSYSCNEFNLTVNDVATNTPTATPCRSPTSMQCHAFSETLMEQIATQIGADPMDLRIANLLQPGDPVFTFDGQGGSTPYVGPNPVPDMIDELSDPSRSDYEARKAEVAQFNSENAFRKRGLSMVPMTWFHNFAAYKYAVHVVANQNDGSVSVSLGGIEMGQGLNTKVAQVVANKLGISDIELISVKGSNSLVAANSDITGGSFGSDCSAEAAVIACDNLLANIENALPPVGAPDGWADRVSLASLFGADLTGRHVSNPPADGVQSYVIYGACVSEVELDVLTGEKSVRRVDLMADTGTSMSPLVDLGQAEGGFVMGMGNWLQEEITFDPDTGRLLNYDTWTYKPPSSQDIPENFRTYLYDSGASTGSTSGILSSKATGEPPLLMAFSVHLALRNAINAAKFGTGDAEWYRMDGPAMNSVAQELTGITSDDFYI